MPNYVQYSTSNLTGSLRKGNVALGVTTASIAGPTSTTNWYTGITPATGKYVIYKTAATGDPDIFCPQTNQELFNFVLMQGGSSSNITSVSASLAWIATQTNLVATNFEYENIVTSGLVLNLDAGFVGSYPTTASTWYDISGNTNNGTLTNSPAFNSANSGSIVFDGVDDYCIFNSSIIAQTSNWTYSSFFSINTLTIGGVLLCQYIAAAFNGRIIIRLSDEPGNLYKLSLFLGSGPTYSSTYINSTIIPTLNTIYNFTVSRNSQTYDLYVNGILNTTYTAAFTASILQTSPIIGGRTNSGGSPTPVNTDFLNGKVFTTQIYNRALSATEILQNYNAQKGRFSL